LSDRSNLFAEIIRRAKMVDGVCPHCSEHTLLISVVQDYYRCLNCGGDIEQKINGKISYLPVDLAVKETKGDGKKI
tara:strand:+ start:183 stop:410 length:228 start_codon:yes stop_codon:yes gene_type:complete